MLIRAGDDRLTDAMLTGHKFARQERLRRAGFRVPRFFCVPVTVFDEVARDLVSPPPPLAREADLLAWAADAAAALSSAALPADVAAELAEAVRDLAGEEGLLAVRACVVADADGNGEDGATDAFAGMTESYLYVRPQDVAGLVARCWASGFSPGSIMYRARRDLPPDSVRVAVGVQVMVPGARSFVAFSRDPRTGEASCVIAAAHGIGEGVVQETADVDHFFVDTASGEIRAELVVKHIMTTRGDGDEGPVRRPVPPEYARAPVLADDEVRAVTRLATDVETFFGLPQDLEGTITPDGEIHLVQARPVVFSPPLPTPSPPPASSPTPAAPPSTAATPAAAEAGSGDGPRVRWTNHNLTESFPGLSGALTYSQARVFYRVIFRDLYRRMGVPDRGLRAREHHLNRMVGLVDGRVYYRVDAWLALHGQIPGFPLVRRWWERSMGLGEDFRPSRAQVARALLTVPALTARLVRLPGEVRDFLRWWDRVVDHSADMDGWAPERLISFYRRLWAEVGRRWGVTLVNTFFLLVWTTLTSAALRRWVTDDEQRLLGGLLMGGRENRSLLGVRSAIALAELVSAHPDLAHRIRACDHHPTPGHARPEPGQTSGHGQGHGSDRSRETRDRGGHGDTPEAIWADITAGRYGRRIAAAATAHLHRYGDRALHDLKLEEPSPRQRPAMIVTMIKPMVHGGLTVADSRARELASRAEAESELRERCPGTARRLVIRALARGLRWSVKTREDTRYCRSQLFGLSRQVLWRLGDHLTEAGRLDRREDVLDLTVEEVLGAYDGTLVDADLRALVRARRDERHRATHRPDPGSELSTLLNHPVTSPAPPPSTPAATSTPPPEPAQGTTTPSGHPPSPTAPSCPHHPGNGRSPASFDRPGEGGPAGAGERPVEGGSLDGGTPGGGSGSGGGAAVVDLRGLPSSRGVVRGEARVVLDPSISPESCRDRIIVAKETDPGWLFLMMAARGMVVERGTLLSHTAITGRLLGIPTVVSVPNATTLIQDGARIEVDGAEGTVRVLPPEEPL
ncbi:hypothetical protein Skr01_14260 [Sphaerisporangium krabiense]|uniref:Pyruvate,water dikinase n=1 Tax=Sphaerisporangium krabiense TaxID=763782 RepID=A0A7W9DN70_9ACTN|nr:PEP/pyruvate-binding domain-containing protein [Sphaerisporangium krabiense]MBB5624699.1 pyruvate,water dikinase [Sphaerisporangium krabiense]GII61341.1 hypothetical protein Skr01_14260 [Sphaerisporangium krabiense]